MKKLLSMLMTMVMMLTMFGTTCVVASADYKSEIAQLEKNIQSWKDDIAWYEANKESTSQYESIYMGEIVNNNPLIVKAWNKYIHVTNPSVAKPDITILGYFGFVESLGYASEYTVNGNTVWAYRAVTPKTYGKEIADLEAKIADAELEIRNLQRDNERPYYIGIVDNYYGVNSYDAIDSLYLGVGDSKELEVVVDKESGNGYYKNSLNTEDFTWSSNKPSVVKVSSDGVVTALKNGTAIITAKGVNSGRKVKCTIKVATPAEKVVLKKDKINLSCGKTYKIKYTLNPTASKDKVYFLSSDETVATVSAKGKITAKNPGKAYIAVIAESGVYSVLTVNVLKKNAPKVSFEYHAVKLARPFNEKYVYPDTMCFYFTEKVKTGYWVYACDFESNIKSYLDYKTGKTDTFTRYYSSYYVYSKKDKEIVQKIVDGKESYGLYIYSPLYSDDEGGYKYEINVGEEFLLIISKDELLKIEGPNKLTSSNNKVATVDEYGFVTGKGKGTATITCEVDGLKSSITVYVK